MSVESPLNFSKIEKRKLVDEVLTQLQEIIQSGSYQIGDRIPSEKDLKDLLGVGRSTLREAIKILAHAGILEVQQGNGTFIRSTTNELFNHETSADRLYELLEAREILEMQMARLAAERRTQKDIEAMEYHLRLRNTYLEEGKYTAYIKSDIQFHLAICAACHNKILYKMYASLCESLTKIFNVSVVDIKTYEDNSLFHNKLFKAIKSGDRDEALNWNQMNLEAFKKKYK
ncbi:FadR/GntR family transcriptional regulator [Amphibacillus cookii]|uniref:FadR/GntR family transcriptional regulator n=1 Tax=Amphibacillus cookii TaxID=767787 RepID=UPI00195D5B4A|nr:FadR/GntR family transcriptional regulator [Amphibacillus cookii]MBM7540716.1 DNA-binding FadR family transcriptional regulator [Amphibacillus cookii]